MKPDTRPPRDTVPVRVPLPPPEPNPKNYLITALSITGRFEGSGYGQVTGNFDAQGISLGVLQWNLGQRSLQEKILKPYIKRHGSIDALKIFPIKIDILASLDPKPAIVFAKESMLIGIDVKPEWIAAWRNFITRPEVIDLQNEAAKEIGDVAEALLLSYGMYTPKAYSFFFDVVTQNGSMKGITFSDCQAFLAQNRMNEVWDWIGQKYYLVVNKYVGQNDAGRNHTVWPKLFVNADYDSAILFIAAYLRSLKATTKYRKDVMNRKGSIALGYGWVHGSRYNFTERFKTETKQNDALFDVANGEVDL